MSSRIDLNHEDISNTNLPSSQFVRHSLVYILEILAFVSAYIPVQMLISNSSRRIRYECYLDNNLAIAGDVI